MKVLLLNGSPNQKGCTYRALCEVAKELNNQQIDSEIVWIGSAPVRGCIGCGACADMRRCVFDDDGVNAFAAKAATADGFVFGSPVHFASACGAMTSFLDRLFCSADKKTFYLKPAAAITSARRAGTTATFDQLNKYFTIKEMPIVSSCYWNNVHGKDPSDVESDGEGLQVMRVLARNMAYLLRCIESGKKAGVPLPKEENKIYTNFIK